MVECPPGQVQYTRKGVIRCRKQRTKSVTQNKRNIIINKLNKIIDILNKKNNFVPITRIPKGVPPPPPPPPPAQPWTGRKKTNNKPKTPPKPSIRNQMLNELKKKLANKKIK